MDEREKRLVSEFGHTYEWPRPEGEPPLELPNDHVRNIAGKLWEALGYEGQERLILFLSPEERITLLESLPEKPWLTESMNKSRRAFESRLLGEPYTPDPNSETPLLDTLLYGGIDDFREEKWLGWDDPIPEGHMKKYIDELRIFERIAIRKEQREGLDSAT